MVEEIKFPLEFKECPNPTCGSTRRVANEVLEGEKSKGKAGPEITAFLFQHQSMIADMGRPVISVPIIFSYFDACADCGMVYCIHVEVKTGTPSGKQSPPMTFGRS